MSRPIGLIASLVGIAAIILALWWVNQPVALDAQGMGRPPSVLPVTLATAEQGTITPRVVFSGTVTSPGRVALSFDLAGVLEELNVRDVDSVSRGQLLARLESSTEQLGVSVAEADLGLARSELAKLEAGTRPEVLARIEAELAEREARAQLAAVEVVRQGKLEEQNITSRSDLDKARAEEAVALAQAEAARQSLAEARVGPRAEDIAIAAARVTLQEARLKQARSELKKTELRAPTDGVVLRREVAVGTRLSPGQSVLEIVDLNQLEVEVEIPSRYAARLGKSPAVRITVDELPELSLAATLDAFVPAADPKSRNFRGLVRLSVDDEAVASLKPGMFVRVVLELEEVAGTIVPGDSIRVTADGSLVVLAEAKGDGLVARWQFVNVLARADGRSVVVPLEGEIAAGAQVVVTGVDLAFPGADLLPRGVGAGAPSRDKGHAGEREQP